MRRWLGAGCALVLICVCISPIATSGQTSASSPAETPKTKSRTAASRKQKKAAATGSKAKSSSGASKSPSQSTAATKSKSSIAARSAKSKSLSSRKGSKRRTARGQQKIDSERAQEIQEALIREHYLTGEASGTWNQACEDAMRRYQADHGWQSKTVPDSRALISLGLGPSHDHLLNPESAMTTEVPAPRASALTPTSHSAEPGAKLSTNPTVPAESTPATSDKNAPNPQ
jgi:hypothetical protein